jgi:uncharacterized membrane protein
VPMHSRTLLVWIAVGLLGLALAAGVTYAATQLSSQRIGLSAEPPSAGEELAPPARHGLRRATTPGAGNRSGTREEQSGDRSGGAPGERRAGGGDRDD